MAALGLMVGAVLIWHEQEQTKHALREAQRQWHRAKIQEFEAQAQREEAEIQKRRAEAHFRKACHGVTRLLLRLEERRWATLPEINELRQALGEQGLAFYQSLLDETNPDPAVRQETGRVYLVLAGVHAMQGHDGEVRKAYGQAVAQFDKLAADFPEEPAYRHDLGLAHNLLGLALHNSGRRRDARAEFRMAVAHYRQALARKPDFRTPNDLSWLLATCPQKEFRDPVEAVQLAEKAARQNPGCGAVWNTLGVARYRAGKFEASVAALRESMRLRSGGDSSDWFFLAMAYWRLGDRERALYWYERALQEIQRDPLCEPLGRYRQEAEAVLGHAGGTWHKDKG
jgi:tetratricopeptide (TPR) repeat protein